MRKAVLALFVMFFPLVSTVYGQEDPNCPGAPEPRLVIGAQGRVLPGDANNVRDAASRGGALVGSIPGGAVFDVLDGPVCADGFNWWQVTYDAFTGWTPEGSGADYWVEPYEAPVPTPTPVLIVSNFEPPIGVVNVVEVGARVRVINEDPNTDGITLIIRAEPSRNAEPVAEVAEGDLLTIIGGSEEADGLRWWQIETESGIQGWVIEGLVNPNRIDSNAQGIYERTLLPLCPVQGERIAYRVIDYLVTSAPDGSAPCVFDIVDEPAWLTFNPTRFAFNNVFLVSPDGTYILYHSGGSLYRMTQDGGERLSLTEGINVYWAAWSPDGTRIAIATGSQIAIIRADGSSFSYLTQEPANRAWVGWQSDSETVIYLEQSRWQDQMGTAIEYTFYRINLREGGLRVLLRTPLELDLYDAAVSPDGSLLAVTGTQYALIDGMSGTTPTKLYLIEESLKASTWIIDLQSETTRAELDESLYSITWLPDNTAIFDIGYVTDPGKLEIIPVNGDTPTEVSLNNEAWSQDYDEFIGWVSDTAFLTYVGYGFQIEPSDFSLWKVDISTGEVQRLK